MHFISRKLGEDRYDDKRQNDNKIEGQDQCDQTDTFFWCRVYGCLSGNGAWRRCGKGAHDCAKGLPTKTKLEKARKHGLPVSKYEEKNPDMLHAKLGAYYARYKYDVVDQVILDAITYHTTGRPNMTLMDKIIFVADYIEPNRKMLPEMEEIRKEAFTDLDACVIHILKNTLDYLNRTTAEMDYMTQKTYDFYVVHNMEL